MGGAGEIGVLRSDQRRDELRLALAEHGGDHQRQQDRGEGELEIDDAHDEGFAPAAEIGGGDAERDADGEGDRAGDQPHLQGDAQAVEDGGEQVAPLRVGAEPMGIAAGADMAGRTAGVGQSEIGEVVRVLRRDQRCQQGDANHQDDDDERRDRDAALPELAPEAGDGRLFPHHARPFRKRGSSAK